MLKGRIAQPPFNQAQRAKKLFITIIVLMVLTITLAWILSALGVITNAVSTIISTICSAISAIAAVVPLLNSSSPASSSPSSALIESFPSTAQTTYSLTLSYRNLMAIPPLTASRVVLQRENAVQKVYNELVLSDVTTVVLTGIGGCGKSTLAALVYWHVEKLRQCGNSPFTASTLWVQVVPSTSMEDLIGTLCEAMGKPLPDLSYALPQDQSRFLLRLLNTADQPRLIILDQFEYLLDWHTGKARDDRPGIGEWIDVVNSQPCRCRFLITSRPWPRGTRVYPSVCMREYAAERFTELEGMKLLLNLGVQATEDELQRVIAYCEGHAYALMLCASLIRHHHITLSTLLNDPAYVRLWTGNVARNLLDSIVEQQLDTFQHTLLLACSVFREPFSYGAMCTVADPGNTLARIQIHFALETLLTQHLFQAVGEGMYQLHAIVSSYAREHFVVGDDLANQQALKKAHSQAAQYYIQLASMHRSARDRRPSADDIHDWLEATWQLCQAGRYLDAYNLIRRENIFTNLMRLGRNTLLLEFCQLLLSDETWSPEQAAYIYSTLGDTYGTLGQNEQAQKNYLQVLAPGLEGENKIQCIHALSGLGRICNTLGNSQQAQAYLEQALTFLSSVQNQAALSQVFTNLGWVYYDQGQMSQASNYFEKALHIVQELEDQRQEGLILGYLGRVADDSGQKWVAQQYYEQAVHLLNSVGDHDGQGIMLANLGRITHVLGESKQGQQYLEQAIQIIKETGDRNGEATVTNDLGMLYAETGDREQAKSYLERSLRLRREVGNRRGESRVLIDLGNVYIDEGNLEFAKESFEQALLLLREIGPGWREIRPLKKLGKVCKIQGQYEQALKYYREALYLCRKVMNRWEECNLIFKIGSLYLLQSRYDVALTFLVHAKKVAEEVRSVDSQEIQEQISFLQIKLGDDQFEKLITSVDSHAMQMLDG